MRPEDLPVAGVEVEHTYVDAAGLRTHVALAGDPAGKPVVLVHGWPQHWWIWRGVIPPLVEAGYRCICPDLRGHGWTAAPSDGYEKEQFATDVLAALDALGVERFRLIGHDWGGFASFLMALREPQRVERLLALSIIHPWIQRDPGPVAAVKGLFDASYQILVASPLVGPQVVRRTPFIKAVLARAVSPDFDWPDGVRSAYADRWREPERAAATQAVYRASLLRDLPGILRGRYRETRLTVPTVLVHGQSDPVITRERVKGWEPYADDMRVGEVPGGHFLPDEKPELVAEQALALFSR
ncbi:MAG TPA: alpha/beta hydrolase [Thermoleophilaceae bacterium]|nr:alpha/beta hydrolase [Thermoleophilaceae bacterium]